MTATWLREGREMPTQPFLYAVVSDCGGVGGLCVGDS
jgi:hypothetical protein